MSAINLGWVGIWGLAVVPLVQTVSMAKTAPEINDIARSITVVISGLNRRGEMAQGSGVILQRQGDTYTILTAAHVVPKLAHTYEIRTPDDREYRIVPDSIKLAAEGIDLAIVKFQSKANYATAKLGDSNSLKGGVDLYVAGFPVPTATITQPVFVFREGKVSANSNKTFENGYSLVYSNDTLGGMSGGPVLNGAGELVAIHGKGDRERNSNGEFGAKTGFNLGISIDRFAAIADKLGVFLDRQVAVISQDSAPKSDDYMILAVQKYKNGDYRGALTEINRAIDLDRRRANAYTYRGMVREFDRKDTQGALADYNRAIQLDPREAMAYNNRGLLKIHRLNDIEGGLADLDRAIQSNPKYATALNNRGYFKAVRLQNPVGGLADLNRAISIDPTSANAYNNRGYVKFFQIKDNAGALADYNRAIQLDSKHELAYNNRGIVKAEIRDLSGSLADFDRAIQLVPNYINAYYNRGSLKDLQLQDPQGALADYNRAIELNPNFFEVYYNRGLLKKDKLLDWSGALADLDTAIKLVPNYANAYNHRGILKFEQFQDNRGALVDFSRAIALDPNYGHAYAWRGKLKCLAIGDRQGSVNDLHQAAKLFQKQGNSASYQLVLQMLQKCHVGNIDRQ